jgi:hypothetical protein
MFEALRKRFVPVSVRSANAVNMFVKASSDLKKLADEASAKAAAVRKKVIKLENQAEQHKALAIANKNVAEKIDIIISPAKVVSQVLADNIVDDSEKADLKKATDKINKATTKKKKD